MEPTNDLYLMLWTGKDRNCSVLYRNHRLIWIMGCEVATRTVDTAGWPMIYQFSCVLGSESTDSGELLKVVITSNKGECELIHEKEGQCVTSVRVESRLARITLDRRMTMEVVRLLLGGICWRHTEYVAWSLVATRVSYGNILSSPVACWNWERSIFSRISMSVYFSMKITIKIPSTITAPTSKFNPSAIDSLRLTDLR
ncbi:hypothetical protein SAMN05216388_101832 [Halorientalis persicus]|uniref:Uncharacterized protein n=1 Tax=Halorientalis persicus TaxID=1367881 RepID=A0A1H8S9R2_9EURY|nr:hypothetical protein SAMN05216388_101832 [Halorientalis persicus]